jgi:hypothetical protein
MLEGAGKAKPLNGCFDSTGALLVDSLKYSIDH